MSGLNATRMHLHHDLLGIRVHLQRDAFENDLILGNRQRRAPRLQGSEPMPMRDYHIHQQVNWKKAKGPPHGHGEGKWRRLWH